MKFNTRAQYIAFLGPIAVAARVDGSPIFPSVRIAQTIQEQGGYSIPDHMNIVGYKVGTGVRTEFWDGDQVVKGTWEEEGGKRVDQPAAFRKYPDVFHCFRDQDLLFYRLADRYRPLIQAADPFSQAKAFGPRSMGGCGYATDSKYGESVSAIIRQYDLTRFDRQAEEEIQSMKEKIAQLESQVQTLLNTADKHIEIINGQGKRIDELERLSKMEEVPSWATAAVEEFAATPTADGSGKILSDKQGSFDFYRILTIVKRITDKKFGGASK